MSGLEVLKCIRSFCNVENCEGYEKSIFDLLFLINSVEQKCLKKFKQ